MSSEQGPGGLFEKPAAEPLCYSVLRTHCQQYLLIVPYLLGTVCSMDVQTVNSMTCEEFVCVFGNVVERCPLIAAALWSRRPFSSTLELENGFNEFIDSLSIEGKEGILRCHPDLAGRELLAGTLTVESRGEQGQAGLTSLSSADALRMNQLNSQYKKQFGFPFVICARMSDKDRIIQQLESRVRNQQLQELHCGIEEVKSICRLRLQDIYNRAAKSTKL
ncbi:2-oxo-4-hydroxy-4-carboxy-5-ureidoimidazoline decarboxylase-like [Huso huso]|uniref:2-oxo-4-hydroxy-4-carboxy-5-ureidoimidazoline decarboxylase n=1 Tax=Huso huso TaxID=61971 RepID=A0ABR0ZN01_HUSHU